MRRLCLLVGDRSAGRVLETLIRAASAAESVRAGGIGHRAVGHRAVGQSGIGIGIGMGKGEEKG